MSKVFSKTIGTTAPYVISAVGLVPGIASQSQVHDLLSESLKTVALAPAADQQNLGFSLERLDLVPKILLRLEVSEAEDVGYEEFITEEHFTEGVTYVQAAFVVEEDPPVHSFDQQDLETIARFEE